MTKIYFKIIRENLPRIVKAINERVKTAEEELQGLGQPMPTDEAGKMSLLWNMINEFCDMFRKVLQGKVNIFIIIFPLQYISKQIAIFVNHIP